MKNIIIPVLMSFVFITSFSISAQTTTTAPALDVGDLADSPISVRDIENYANGKWEINEPQARQLFKTLKLSPQAPKTKLSYENKIIKVSQQLQDRYVGIVNFRLLRFTNPDSIVFVPSSNAVEMNTGEDDADRTKYFWKGGVKLEKDLEPGTYMLVFSTGRIEDAKSSSAFLIYVPK